MDNQDCHGGHRYFVADTGTVEYQDTAKVCVVIVCTACGESQLLEHTVLGKPRLNTQKKEN